MELASSSVLQIGMSGGSGQSHESTDFLLLLVLLWPGVELILDWEPDPSFPRPRIICFYFFFEREEER